MAREKVSHALRSKPRKGDAGSSRAAMAAGVIPSALGVHQGLGLVDQGPAKRQKLSGLLLGSSPYGHPGSTVASMEAAAAIEAAAAARTAAAVRAAAAASALPVGYPSGLVPPFANQLNLPLSAAALGGAGASFPGSALAMRQAQLDSLLGSSGVGHPLLDGSADPQVLACLMLQRSRGMGNNNSGMW